jgi:hypothetical protein
VFTAPASRVRSPTVREGSARVHCTAAPGSSPTVREGAARVHCTAELCQKPDREGGLRSCSLHRRVVSEARP